MLYDWLCICYKGLDYVLFKVIFFVYNMIPTQDVTFILPVNETLYIFKTSLNFTLIAFGKTYYVTNMICFIWCCMTSYD